MGVERIGVVDQADHREPEIRIGGTSTEFNQNLLGTPGAETVDKVAGVQQRFAPRLEVGALCPRIRQIIRAGGSIR